MSYQSGPHNSKIGIILGTVGGVIGLLIVGMLFLICEDDRRIAFGQLKRFAWRELQIATDNFNERNVLGQGGFGKVYKGVLPDATKIAVKRLTDYESPGGEAAFLREVELISVAVHRNLLSCKCTADEDLSLLYGDFGLAKLVDVKKLQREGQTLDSIVDGNLNQNYDNEELEMIIQIALLCTQASPEDRPSMSEVVRMLEGEGLAERWEEWAAGGGDKEAGVMSGCSEGLTGVRTPSTIKKR
ncbi:hypothetical protein HU200_052473 [Digitaria exilis]|uniref:Tyrosine-protein kinase catalytic domain-containing protein n=1 Tax=Digitaria exilis TaxID=1010633 RepID=A0A835APV5_9POAL|nr:hypothetical protein HU200_052473 [Digitaria exilis]